MSYGSRASTYLETQVLSASPGQLVVMLYDHLLLQLRRARVGIEKGDAATRQAALDKARAVLAELMGTLDYQRGGEIARQLSGIYAFLLAELLEVGLRPSAERLDPLSVIVTDLREAYDTISRQPAAATQEVA